MHTRNGFKSVDGARFGAWTVVGYAGKDKRNNALAQCLCDCGKSSAVKVCRLKEGLSRSCGCQVGITHGKSRTSEHYTWKNIKQRTTNKNRPDYARYGGRGVKMCKRWLESFEAFMSDMGPKPSPLHSIDRIDTNGDYEPSHCRWADSYTHANNSRKNVWVVINNERMTVSQAARAHGINQSSLSRRLKRGLDINDAISIKKKSKHTKHDANCITKSKAKTAGKAPRLSTGNR